jgi:ribosomal protein S18 acetylase RimI-like enzyme
LHRGLIASFADLLPRIEGGSIDQRAGHRVVVCPAIPVPGFNGVWIDGPDSSTAFDDLRRAVEEVDAAGVPCWLEVLAGVAPSFEAAAERLGFRPEESISGMVLRRDELIPGPPVDVDVARAEEPAALSEAASVAAMGFEVPVELFGPLYTRRVSASPNVDVFVARIAGEAVSTAVAWRGDGGVGIYSVATPPGYRRRGFGRAVTEHAVRAGFAAGADLAWLQASSLGEPVYRAMGFRRIGTYLILGREERP